jgi:hypothetical protein
MVHHLMAGPVVASGEHLLGDRHADRVADALAERAGGDLDARGLPLAVELGVPRGLGSPLPELLEVLHREVVAREVQRRVLEDAGMTGREHEAVAAGPGRIGGIVAHALAVEHVADGRERHRRAGMSGIGLLHRVHGEAANRVDRECLDVSGGHGAPRRSRVPEP